MGRSCKKTKKTTQTKEQKVMPSPKYKINDEVNKKRNTGILLKTGSARGTITEVKEKFNAKNHVCFYYVVKWPDGRRSEHAQHILTPAP